MTDFFVSLPPWGRGTTVVVDEVPEFYTVQTASTSSVLPCGNPPSPRGKAYEEGKTAATNRGLRSKYGD